jgi:hypothetical protein
VATAVSADSALVLLAYTDPPGGPDAEVLAVRRNGSTAWTLSLPRTGGIASLALAASPEPTGGYALAGTGGGRAFLVRLDGAGSVLRDTTFEGGGSATAVALDTAGRAYLAGTADGIDLGGGPVAAPMAWVAAFDP